MCYVLTNFHSINLRLSFSDGSNYIRHKNRLYEIGDCISEKLRLAQERYGNQWRRRSGNFRSVSQSLEKKLEVPAYRTVFVLSLFF